MPAAQSTLSLGIRHGRIDMLEQAIADGADVNKQTGLGELPLALAIKMRKPSTLKWLLDHNADPNKQDKYGNTSIHVAAQQGDITALDLLLERGGHINAENKQKETPLFLAAYTGDAQMVDHLLEHGAISDCPNISGMRPHDIARGMAIQISLSHAARREQDDPTAWQDFYREITPKNDHHRLLLAVVSGDQKTTTDLLAKGIDPDNKEMMWGKTCLVEALKGGRTEMAALLLQHEANPNAPDKNGIRPVHAALYSPISMLPLLKKYGADVNATSRNRTTALHQTAVMPNKADHIDMLLALGANPLHKNSAGKMPSDLTDNQDLKTRLEESGLQWDLKLSIEKWRKGGDNPGPQSPYRRYGQ